MKRQRLTNSEITSTIGYCIQMERLRHTLENTLGEHQNKIEKVLDHYLIRVRPDAQDWQAYFDERAGIAGHDGGLARADAERQAFECCVSEWLWRNPPLASGPERCAHCGKPLGEDGLPYLTGDGGHAWLHSRCHGDWMRQRRAEAVAALTGHGLTPPESREGAAQTEAHQTCPEQGLE